MNTEEIYLVVYTFGSGVFEPESLYSLIKKDTGLVAMRKSVSEVRPYAIVSAHGSLDKAQEHADSKNAERKAEQDAEGNASKPPGSSDEV